MFAMYGAFLVLHSLLRWALLLGGLVVVARAIAGLVGRPWSRADDTATRVFTVLLDVQVLVGLMLYLALSPLTQAAFRDLGDAMSNDVLRFWAVEHAFGMLSALVLAHVGRAKVRAAGVVDQRRHRTALVYFGLCLAVVLISMPWPSLPYGRPLWRHW
jgi:hypothetical protein